MPNLLVAAAAVLFLCRLALLIALHVRPGGIHPIRDTVSDYAASANILTRRLSTSSSWAAALAWAALGAGILVDSKSRAGGMTLGIWLIVLALVLAVIPWVPTDGPGQPRTLRGRLHLLLAIGWFTISYATIAPLAQLLDARGMASIGAALHLLSIVAAIALAALIVSLIVRPLRTRTFGVSERVFILVVTLAPLLASIGLAVRA